MKKLTLNFGVNGGNKLTKDEYDKLINQVIEERELSRGHMYPKWDYWKKRVKIYANRKKQANSIGDPLVFTQFQTLLAALYDDKLMTKFQPQERGDTEMAQNLNPLYEADAETMKKFILDFQWIWNTLFFGRGLVMMSEWDTKLLCPSPEIINMLTWHRDPYAKSVNGDAKGKGAMRFGGRPIYKTKREIELDKNYKNFEWIEGIATVNAELEDAETVISEAQGLDAPVDVCGDNMNYSVYEHLTWFKDNRVLVAIHEDSTILRYTILKRQDRWPIEDRSIFPDPLSWDGTSALDLLEDKQRARARILNAALYNVESNTYNMGFYDANKIRKKSHLKFARNKMVPVNGSVSGAYEPMRKQQMGGEVNNMMDMIENISERATGAGANQQGVATQNVITATESANIAEKSDARFSLAAKIFGWSEQAFAMSWFQMYKDYFTDEINTKILRINGLTGYNWKELKKSDIVGQKYPDIKVESVVVSEATRIRKLQTWTNSYNFLAADPNVNKEFLTREGAKLNGYSETEIQVLFAPDTSRIIADRENQRLRNGEIVDISKLDDHIKHIDEHQKEDITKPEVREHIDAHYEQMVVESTNIRVQEEKAKDEAIRQAQKPAIQGGAKQIQPVDFSQPKSIQTA